MKKILYIMIIFGFVASVSGALAAMTSSNYQIDWDNVSSGGLDQSSSANYSLEDTIGQLISGQMGSDSYLLNSGYRQAGEGEDILIFNVGAQLNSSRTAYTLFDYSSNQVTVVATSSFQVNDRIVVVENEGQAQLVVIGRIVDINNSVITVDKWDGEGSGMSMNPGGSDDNVYRLFGQEVDLGLLDINSVKTSLSYVEVSTNIGNGYTVTMAENHDLSNGINDVSDVSDGEVTVNNEEYGIETVGSDAQGSGDWSITGDKQNIAYSTLDTIERRTGIIHKIAIGNDFSGGSYAHTVSYYCTVNY